MKKGQINEAKLSIAKIIKDSVSTLSFEDGGEDFLVYATRENGDVGEEVHSDEDYNDAYNIQKKISHKYGCSINVEIETVDEWVYLNVKFNK